MSDTAPACPVAAEEADDLLRTLAAASGLLLAVSGGPDSMALLALAAGWRERLGRAAPTCRVATVDHGLRPEARDEAAAVGAAAARLGLPHAILAWEGPKPRTGVQEAARGARYALLAAEARRTGASHVVTGHHADDQAETILMRLLAGSGLEGLAGMAPERDLGGLRLARPLLGVPKARLVATAVQAGLPVAADPSNADPAYRRTRLRRLAALLEAEGLGPTRLLRLGERAARAERALAAMAEAQYAGVARSGDQVVLPPSIHGLPPEILVRLLLRALSDCAGAPAPRLERVERLAALVGAARAGGTALRRTLAGCIVSLDRHGQVTIVREGARHRGTGRVHDPQRSAR